MTPSRTFAVLLLFSISAPHLVGQQKINLASTPPSYLRHFQSDRDASRPTRLEQFAFRVSGFPANEDLIAKNETDWNVDPLVYPSKIVTDSAHVVRSTHSLPQRIALNSFADVIANHTHSHNLFMARPTNVITDSGERVIVSDPAAHAIHVFDLKANRYFRIQGGDGRRLQMPWGVAVDNSHNIYVTDVELGMILVYDPDGRFLRYIGKRTDGEGGSYNRPTGIAIDRKSGRLYLLDTTRNMILVLDSNGRVFNRIGRPDLDRIELRRRDGVNAETAKLQFPTDIVIRGGEVFVLGKSHINIFDLDGHFEKEFEVMEGSLSEATGLAVDAYGTLYVSDPARGSVDAYKRDGTFVQSFGAPGSKHGEFSSPQGLWVDEQNCIYVADAANGRVQVFQIHGKTAQIH